MNALLNVVIYLSDVVFPPRATQLLARQTTIEFLLTLLAPRSVTLADANNSLEIWALAPYKHPVVQALILEAKFHHNRRAQKLLGQLLATYLKHHIKVCANLALVPIPLGKARRKERGYNQVEEIARFAQEFLKPKPLLLSDALIRTRATAPQTSLGRDARLTNMRGAFGAVPFKSLAPLAPDPSTSSSSAASITHILLDDVITTGATLLSAHSALKAGGAEHIVTLALAY